MPCSLYPNTKEAILAYIKHEFDLENVKEAKRILENELSAETEKELNLRFNNYITFGTAGIRGRLECGFNRMNYLTVCGTAQGICDYFLKRHFLRTYPSIIIGYDGRYKSKNFANLVAAIFLSKSFQVIMLDSPIATPLVAFGVLRYNCNLGIQITASHNPKNDNGIKLYNEQGLQLPAADEAHLKQAISNCIEPQIQDIEKYLDMESYCLKPEAQNLINCPETILDDYINTVLNGIICNFTYEGTKDTKITSKIVYTPVHGVGKKYLERIFNYYGINEKAGNLIIVSEQAEPDPEFRTVTFPNPEENNTLDLAIQTANKHGAKIIIANDPDADRFSIAEKLPNNEWYIFKGDQIGVIFAGYLMTVIKNVPKEKQAYFASAVSSGMLSYMAKQEGCQYYETMTGFKNILNKAKEIESKNIGVPILAYEEALGYAVDVKNVPDKDGLSSTALFIQILKYLEKHNLTVYDYLLSLYNKYGYFITQNSYAKCTNVSVIKHILDEFRNKKYASEIGSYKITRIRDITCGYDSAEPDSRCPADSNSQMITIYFDVEARITIRASGTEPKIKYYSEIRTMDPQIGKKDLNQIVNSVIETILQPSKYDIKVV